MVNVSINKLLRMDLQIYRFVSFPMLMTLIEMKKMPLKKILLWDDTYEVPLKFYISDEKRTLIIMELAGQIHMILMLYGGYIHQID